MSVLRFRSGLSLHQGPAPGDDRGRLLGGLLGRCLALLACIGLPLALLAASTGGAAAQGASDVECEPGKVCRLAKTRLPLRLLPRAQANVYEAPDPNSRVVEADVAAFVPLFVFERNGVSYADPLRPSGWFRVAKSARDGERPFGYMRAADALEWKSAIVLSYTHRGVGDNERKPVLMFKDRRPLETFISESKLPERAAQMYRRLEQGDAPPEIITREPDTFVDIRKKFYLLPVLEAVQLDDPGLDDVRMLQLAAAVPNARKRAEDQCTTERARDFARCSRETGTIRDDELKINVVYVMDFTGSMGPPIDAVKRGMRDSVRQFSQVTAGDNRVRFGLVGFRDHLESDKQVDNEFVAKNFTPALIPAGQFVPLMDQVAKAKGGGDLEEEVFAGMVEGINSKWDEGAIRIIFLIGDASGHDPSHKWATTKHNTFTIRQETTTHQINVASIYIKIPEQSSDWARGQQQFRELAENPGSEPAFRTAEKDDANAIISAINEATAVMVERLRKIRAERAAGTAARGRPDEGPLKKAFDVGLVEFLGKATEPPKDITAWVVDKDLTNLGRKSFEVNALVTRTDLEQLSKALQTLIQAYENTELSNESFFKTLQSLTALTGLDEPISKATALGRSSLLPRWIEALPYKSEITSMTFSQFEEETPDKRQQRQLRLRSLVQLYNQLLQRPQVWHQLNDQLTRDEWVYPLSLDSLP